MSAPDKKALLNWATQYPILWNAGNKQAWIDSYRTVCPGDKVTMLDPVGPQVQYSIETYRFGADGSLEIRTYYRVPTHGNEAIGDIFKEYLPENEAGL